MFLGDKDLQGIGKAEVDMETAARPAFLRAASPCASKVRTGTWSPGFVFAWPGTMTVTLG